MNACLILALQELVRRDINTEPYVLEGEPWAARSEVWYARRLNVSTGRMKELLSSPEFEIFELRHSGYRLPLIRLRDSSRATTAHERQKLLREVFIDALSQWKKIEEIYLQRSLDEAGGSDPGQAPDASSARLQRMKFSRQMEAELLDADPEVAEYLQTLSSAWGYLAPFVLRVAVDEWSNFLDIGKEMVEGHRAAEWLPTDDTEVPNLETIAFLPMLGLIIALSQLDDAVEMITNSGIEEPLMEWFEDLEAALHVEETSFELQWSSLKDDEQGEDLEVDAQPADH